MSAFVLEAVDTISSSACNAQMGMAWITGATPQAVYTMKETGDTYQTARVISLPASNYGKFIGVSESAASSGDSATITTPYGVNAYQSGLTTGATYYVDRAGVITADGTTKNPIKIGFATSATNLLLTNWSI